MKVMAIGREQTVVDTAVDILQANGFAAVGTVVDAAALAALDTGEITNLIIGGGVEPESREALKKQALAHGAAVHEAKRRGRGIESYLNEVVIPTLRQ
jgi:hypothetical protein